MDNLTQRPSTTAACLEDGVERIFVDIEFLETLHVLNADRKDPEAVPRQTNVLPIVAGEVSIQEEQHGPNNITQTQTQTNTNKHKQETHTMQHNHTQPHVP